MKRWHEFLLTSSSAVMAAVLLAMLMLVGAGAMASEEAPITTFRQLQQYHDLDKRYPEATALFERTLMTQIKNGKAIYPLVYVSKSALVDKTRVELLTGFCYAVDGRFGKDIGELSHTKVTYGESSSISDLVIRYVPDNGEDAADVMLLSFNGAMYHYPVDSSEKKIEYLGRINTHQTGPSFIYTYVEIEGMTLYSEYSTSQFVFHHTSTDDIYQLLTLNAALTDEMDIVRDRDEIAPRNLPTYEEYIKLLDILIKKESNPRRTYAELLQEGGYAPYNESAEYAFYDGNALYAILLDRLTDEMRETNESFGGAYADSGWASGDVFELRDVDVRMKLPSGTEIFSCFDPDVMLSNKQEEMFSFLMDMGFEGHNRDPFVDLLITQDANGFMLLGIKNLGLSAERVRETARRMIKFSGVSLVEELAFLGQGSVKVHTTSSGAASHVYIVPREDGMYILGGSEKYIEEKILLRSVTPASIEAELYSGEAWERAYALFLLSGEYLLTAEYYPDESNYGKPIAYALEDMDIDGIPELVIYNGSSIHAGEAAYVYRYDGAAVRYISMVPGGGVDDGPIYVSANRSYPGLLTSSGGGGYYETCYHTLRPEEGWYTELVFAQEWDWSGNDAWDETLIESYATEDVGLYQASQEPLLLPFFSLGELRDMFAEWAGSSRREAQPYQPGRQPADQGIIPSPGYVIYATYLPEADMTFYERVYDDGFRMSISEQGYRIESARGNVDYAVWGRGSGTVDKLDYALLAAVPNMSGLEAWAHLQDSFPDTCPIIQNAFTLQNVSGMDYCVFEVDKRHAIVAFGGTKGDESADLIADVQILLGSAVKQASIARDIINALPYDEVMVTGHSLGGYVAVETAVFCSKVVECVVFDAPGRGGNVGENTYMENWNPKVVNYYEAGDKIHTVGVHPGKTIEVSVGSNAIENIFGQHDIRNFIDAWTQ